MKKASIAITIGITCVALTIAICVQLNTIQKANTAVSKSYAEDSLRDEVLKAKEKYDNAARDLTNAEKELANVRESATKDDETSSIKEAQIKQNNNLLGITEVKGAGIELNLRDDPNATRESVGVFGNVEDHVVHYNDLIWLVNLLNNAGAEAISINDQRIVNTTSIVCVGNVIKINDEKVGTPFTIRAIGLPEKLAPAIDIAGGYLEMLREYGIVVNLKKMDEITIPKYNAVISAKYMKTQN